jgi:uncharacterized repeat protein (TIGR02543 family)
MGVRITNYNGRGGRITIPTEINGVAVTEIGNGVFWDVRNLVSVVIPDTVTRIGDNAFRDCFWLETIELPNSVTSLGANAFQGCTWLESITLSMGLTSIADNTFRNAISLTEIIIPPRVTSIGWYAFFSDTVYNWETWEWEPASSLRTVTFMSEKPPASDNSFTNAPVNAIYVPIGSWLAYSTNNAIGTHTAFSITEIEFETGRTVSVQAGTGGTATGSDTYFPGETVTLTATVDTGYIFAGWFINGVLQSTNLTHTFTLQDENVTIEARFTLNPFTVTFNPNGGSVTPLSATTATDGRISSLPTPTRSGYTFNGWFSEAVGGIQINTNTVYSSNTTIFARWTAMPTYNINFNANGGIVSPTSGITGTNGRLTSLPTPTRSGFTFNGWFSSATGGTAVNTDTIFIGASTIFAQWTEISQPIHTITFNPNGGTVSQTSRTTGTDGRLSSIPTPTRNGFTFDGWYTSIDGGTLINTSTIFTSNTTIFAQWTEISSTTFTITFNSNGGTVSVTSATTGTDGRLLSLPTPTRSGHTFNGWFTALTGGTQVTTNTQFFTSTIIYARWTSTSGGGNTGGSSGGGSSGGGSSGGGSGTISEARTITFNLNGGTHGGSTANFTRTTQDSGVLAASQRPADPTRAGYTFNGWFTAATGGTQRNIATFTFTANTTLFAQWIAVSSGDSGSGNNNTSNSNNNSGIQINITGDNNVVIIGGNMDNSTTTNITTTTNTTNINNTTTNTTINTINNTTFNIPTTIINNINVNIPFHQIKASGSGNINIDADPSLAGQNAVLVQYNEDTGELEFVTSGTIGANGSVNINIPQSGDFLVLTFKTGDITGTGEVQTTDALALLRHVAGISELNSIQQFVANGKEGDVGTNDALNILRFVAGVIDKI